MGGWAYELREKPGNGRHAPPPPGSPTCPGGGKYLGILGCPVTCVVMGTGPDRTMCCQYINPGAGQPGQGAYVRKCTSHLATIDPFGKSEPPPPRETALAEVVSPPKFLAPEDRHPSHVGDRRMYRHGDHCPQQCQCRSVPPTVTTPQPDGSSVVTAVQPAGGSGLGLCWAAAGGQALVPAGATIPIPITVANYSWLRPRHMNMSSSDALLPESNPTRFLRVLEVTGLGRNVIGSVAGIAGASIDAYADNPLQFGRNVASISSSNAITVLVRNDGPNDLLVSPTIEGWGTQ